MFNHKSAAKKLAQAKQAAVLSVLPVAEETCFDCSATAGLHHELGCPKVSLEMYNAVMDALHRLRLETKAR